ncbi:MAG: hypothetical protein HY741_21425 [Chloroflexi bacterium]|nr:hypothetical protein [Chloroflexota bacterium]
MKSTRKAKKKMTELEIDAVVVAQADDDSNWSKPVRVRRNHTAAVSISLELATRAAFLARLHHQASIQDWLRQIIQERIELEEAAFLGAKRELLMKHSA